MAKPSVAIRLATEGKAQVKNDFAELAQAGDATTQRLVANYEQQAQAAERAAERAARTADKIAAIAPQSSMQMQVNSAVGSNLNYQSAAGGMKADFEGSARRSALAMKELIAEEEQLEQRTRALLSAIDPVWAAQDRFNREMTEAKTLLDAGRISTDQYAQAERRAKEALDDTSQASARSAEMSNQARFGYRQIQYQISDVSSQLAMGTNAFVIFAQQAPDFAYALQMIADGAGAGSAAISANVTATNAHAGAARVDARDTAASAIATDAAATAVAAHLAAIGPDGVATNAHASAARADATAMGADAVATEALTVTTGAHTVAIGADTSATGAHAVAVGADTAATNTNTAAGAANIATKGRLVTFLTGPYGAAVMGAVTLAGIFAMKMDWSGDAVAKATKELQKHAKEADATREAGERWKTTIEGLTEASRKLEDQTKHLNESAREAAERAVDGARETLNLTIKKREQAEATLQQAKAELELAAAMAGGGDGGLAIVTQKMAEVTRVEGELKKVKENIDRDRAALVELEISKGKRDAGAIATAEGRANEEYAASIDRIEEAYRRSAKTVFDYTAYVAALAIAQQKHKVALDAVRESERDRDQSQTRFAAPLRSMNVAHPFGEPRGGRNHAGVDLSAGVGTPVFADAAGVARRKNDPKGYGYYIEIDHGRGVKSRFAHLSEYLVADGARVEQGQQIALSGGARGAPGAGNSKDPHLHYEIRKGGRPVNPIGGAFGIDPLGAREGGGGENREETLRRQAEAMEQSAKGALALAEAYLESGEAAIRAEAQREGATDAIRSGAEAEAQVRRQLNLDIAEGAAQGAKAVAQMRDETSTRAEINKGVSSGAIAVADMNRVLTEEAALRPLLKLQALAQGDALTTLTKVIEAYKKALAEAHHEEARGEALVAIDAAAKRIEDIRAIMPLVGDPRAREIEEARRAAIREADAKGLKPTDVERTDLIDSRVEEARAGQELQRAEYAANAKRDHEESMTLLQAELDLLGLGEAQRERSLKLLAYELELNRQLGPEHKEQIADLLKKAEAEESLRAELDRVRDSLDEARQIGEDFVDTVFDPRNWKDWGDLGKRILNELAEDFIRLAILNPIKNEAFGQNNPTLGSVFSAFGSFFGGEGSAPAGDGGFWDSLGASIGSNAMGTEYWRGGLTEVGENGKELVELPRGSKIRTAAETRRLVGANDGGPRVVQHIDFRGAVVTDELYRDMERAAARAIDRAAPDIAAMGVQMTADAIERRMLSF